MPMNPIESTTNRSTEALTRYGYTARQAEFLRLVGFHSGYFVRRQYVQFMGKSGGGTASALIEKAVMSDHVKVSACVANLHLYHLASRALYAALGEGDNRNRRDRQPLTIKSKLMALDFVLEHPSHRYLATERAKVEYFTGTAKVELAALPTKRYSSKDGTESTARYFVEKFPIYLARSPNAEGSEMGFAFIDPGATSVSGFETFLDRYRGLFSALPCFRVVYVATRPILFHAAEHLFHRYVRQDRRGSAPAQIDVSAHLRAYFETRFLYETGDRLAFDREKLIRLRDQRRALAARDTEALYARWRNSREHAATALSQGETAAPAPLRGAFSVCLLSHNYDVFGTLTAL
jgi:hypothetical protein